MFDTTIFKSDRIHIFEAAQPVLILQRHLDGRRIRPGVGGIERGKVGNHSDVRHHHLQIRSDPYIRSCSAGAHPAAPLGWSPYKARRWWYRARKSREPLRCSTPPSSNQIGSIYSKLLSRCSSCSATWMVAV